MLTETPIIEFFFTQTLPYGRTNMTEIDTVKDFLKKHPKRKYSLSLRSRTKSRRGISWPVGEIQGVKEFEALLLTPEFEKKKQSALSL